MGNLLRGILCIGLFSVSSATAQDALLGRWAMNDDGESQVRFLADGLLVYNSSFTTNFDDLESLYNEGEDGFEFDFGQVLLELSFLGAWSAAGDQLTLSAELAEVTLNGESLEDYLDQLVAEVVEEISASRDLDATQTALLQALVQATAQDAINESFVELEEELEEDTVTYAVAGDILSLTGDDGTAEMWQRLAPSQVQLLVEGRVGFNTSPSPMSLQVRNGRTVRFTVYTFTEDDASDRQEVEDYTWEVPEALGTVLEPGLLEMTTAAPVSEDIVFAAEGVSTTFRLITRPNSVEAVTIEPAEVEVSPGEQVTFSAKAWDEFGNSITGRSFRWVAVGGIGEIAHRTGRFTAGDSPSDGFIVAVVSRTLDFGEAGTAVEGSGKVVVTNGLPDAVGVSNGPNPFNPETTVHFDLPEAGDVHLSVFNLAGQEIRTLVSENRTAGYYQTVWDGRDQAGRHMGTGTYLLRLQVGNKVESRKIMLLR
ncbi:MAG: T9SS type A sorting domain-containing protein [Candidatus Latescibacteria bacterium]|nr:T9SS type A sorting domain-containing protein [Candidatus Latescibacterota bacterium]